MSYPGTRWAGSSYRPTFFGGFSLFPPVIRALLIINVAIWLLLDVLLQPFRLHDVPIFAVFAEYLALWPLGENFWPWQLLTYMFMHGGLVHLLFNMLALWMFGMELETIWGSRRFLVFYLVCGLVAGVANILVAPLLGQTAPTVGASGAVFGVLIAFAMLFPDRLIYLYFLLPVKAKYLVTAYIGLELFFGVTGTTDGIAHMAHLGGAAAGFLMVLAMRSGVTLGWLWPAARPKPDADTYTNVRFIRREPVVTDAQFHDIENDSDDQAAKGRQHVTQEMVDAILDKINRDGYQSLTESEKRILTEASKHIN
jgi:membrane associated rhomboid family serine protease